MLKQIVLLAILSVLLVVHPASKTGTGPQAAVPPNARGTLDELAALLPPSHLVATLDMPGATRDLLPRLRTIQTGGVAKLVQDIESFMEKAGIDPQKVTGTLIGLRLEGINVRGGVLIANGVALDVKRLQASAAAAKWQFETLDLRGKAAYRITRFKPSDPANPSQSPVKDAELVIASLGPQRVVVGDTEGVTAVLHPVEGTAKSNEVQIAALKETRTTALVRFGLTLPEGLREVLKSQGELFEQLAAVKVIFGTIDLTPEKDGVIDSRLRTASKEHAVQMQDSLKSLVFLGKSFLSGNQDPRLETAAKLLDEVKIATDVADVTLTLKIPSAVIDQLAK
jgi:hypothetical protein